MRKGRKKGSTTRTAASSVHTPDDATAADSYAGHLRAISTLLLDTLHQVNVLQEEARDRKISQTETAGMERAREFTVEAAWALGAITAAKAKAKHGVVL